MRIHRRESACIPASQGIMLLHNDDDNVIFFIHNVL